MHVLSWQQADRLAATIRDRLDAPLNIVALGRGAMVPARLLSTVQPVFYMGLRSYTGQEKGLITQYQSPSEQHLEWLNAPTTLIVDDLWDSGQTFAFAKNLLPKAKTAALVAKTSEHSLDYVGQVLTDGSWVVFPWEGDND